MARMVIFVLVFGLVGLVGGYWFFVRWSDVPLSVTQLFSGESGLSYHLGFVRRQVVLSGLSGATAGVLFSLSWRG